MLATVVGVTGSAPRPPGARMLVRADGSTEGSTGGGEVEQAAIDEAQQMHGRGGASAQLLETGTDCGGKVSVFLERLDPARRLVIVGAGHVGKEVALLAARAGFSVTLLDPAPEGDWPPELGIKVVTTDDPAALGEIERPGTVEVLIATGTHEADRIWAVPALELGFAGVGVVGSIRKAKTIAKAAAKAGVASDRISAIRCPVGLPIGSVTPFEIAVAIVAELISVQRTGSPQVGARKT